MVFSVLEYSPEKYWVFTGEGLFELNKEKVSRIQPLNIEILYTPILIDYHLIRNLNISIKNLIFIIHQ